MKYTWTPKGGTTKQYVPKWTILNGPDDRGTCKCYDEVTKSTVFLNINELNPIQ